MTEVNGLPAHILLVHLIVVLVPLTAIGVLLCAFWPAARRRLVWPTLVLAMTSLVMTPVTTDAGEWLQRRVADTPLVRNHVQLGDQLLPWTLGLALLSALIAFLHVREHRRRAAVTDHAQPAVGNGSGTEPGRIAQAEGAGGDGVLTASPPVAVADRTRTMDRILAIAIPVLAVVLAIGSSVQVYRIGDSGAQAVWHNQFSSTPHPAAGGDGDGG